MPVVFLHTEPPTFSQYLGLMTVADAFIATSLREGMNLTAHEFVKCQSKKHRPVILSEFTGSYSYSSFRSCLPVNPVRPSNSLCSPRPLLTTLGLLSSPNPVGLQAGRRGHPHGAYHVGRRGDDPLEGPRRPCHGPHRPSLG